MKNTGHEYLSKISSTIKKLFGQKETTSEEIKDVLSDDKKAKILLKSKDGFALVLAHLSDYTGLSIDVVKKIFVQSKKDNMAYDFDAKAEHIAKTVMKHLDNFRPEDHEAIAHLLIDRRVGDQVVHNIDRFKDIKDYKKLFDHLCKKGPIFAGRAIKSRGEYVDKDYMKQKVINDCPVLSTLI